VIDGKRLRISEYKQLLKAKKLADCSAGGGGGRTGRHHQLWRDVKAPPSSPGTAGSTHYQHGNSGAGSVNGTASAAAAAAAAESFTYSTHHCSPCAASTDPAYGIRY